MQNEIMPPANNRYETRPSERDIVSKSAIGNNASFRNNFIALPRVIHLCQNENDTAREWTARDISNAQITRQIISRDCANRSSRHYIVSHVFIALTVTSKYMSDDSREKYYFTYISLYQEQHMYYFAIAYIFYLFETLIKIKIEIYAIFVLNFNFF